MNEVWLDTEMLDLSEAIQAIARVVMYRLQHMGIECPNEVAALAIVSEHIADVKEASG